MEIPVVVESVAGNGFRASAGLPVIASAEAPTRDEALARLQSVLQQRVAAGEIVPLQIPNAREHPWMPFAGTLKDDPWLEPWKKAMADHRREMDADLGHP